MLWLVIFDMGCLFTIATQSMFKLSGKRSYS